MILGPSVPGPRPVLFDLGDTLMHFSRQNVLPDFRRGLILAHEHLREQGLTPPSPERYRACCRRWFLIDYVVSLLRRREVDVLQTLAKVHRSLHLPADPALLLAVCQKAYEPQRESGEVDADVHTVLEELTRRDHPLALVSNTMVPGPILDAHLQAEGLLRYFPVRAYSSEVGFRKPHPRIFRAALMGLNAKPQGCVFVGDKPALDVRGARRLGMVTVLKQIRPGRSWPWRPDFVVRRLAELPSIVDRLGPSPEHPVAARER
jgi:HAD superfamily hydrolase (TIGR01509 family)